MKPGNYEEARLSLNKRLDLWVQDMWGAMEAHGIPEATAVYTLSGVIQDLLSRQVMGERDGEQA